MAIYQYQLIVVPRQTILQHWDIIPVKIQVRDNPAFDEDDLINVKWWDKEKIEFKTIEKSILVFADQVEWTKGNENVKTFGDNDTNDITITKGEFGKLEEMYFRIDLREIEREFIDNVLTIVKDLDCLLLDRQGNLFEPTLENLSGNIKKSNAFKFVTNPTDFLDKLGKEIEME
jgi:hypothetical protein